MFAVLDQMCATAQPKPGAGGSRRSVLPLLFLESSSANSSMAAENLECAAGTIAIPRGCLQLVRQCCNAAAGADSAR